MRGSGGEKRYLLDCQVKNDRHLAEIARKVTDWNLVLPYLMARESLETEEAILGNYQTVERRRLVTSRVTESLNAPPRPGMRLLHAHGAALVSYPGLAPPRYEATSCPWGGPSLIPWPRPTQVRGYFIPMGRP